MTVLDACAVVSYFRSEPARPQVIQLLRQPDAALTAAGLAEVMDHLVRVMTVDEDEAQLDLAELGLLDALPVLPTIGSASGRLRARHYHRTRCSISMADCIAAETARLLEEPLATSDPPLLEVCHIEGIDTIVLSGSDGSRWRPAR